MISILLVEDNELDKKRIIKILRERSIPGYSSDYDIHYSETLRDALAKTAYTYYDIILLDLNLPDRQGIETFEIMYKKLSEKQTPILITTGLIDLKIVLEAIKLGAAGYLVKDWIYKSPSLLQLTIHSTNMLYRQKKETHKLLQEKFGSWFPTIRRCPFCTNRIGYARYQKEDTGKWENLEGYLLQYDIGVTDGVCSECFDEVIKK